jgi:hypothetical protein
MERSRPLSVITATLDGDVLGVLAFAARRDHSPQRGIDIPRCDQPESLSALVTAWTGNDCRTLTFTEIHVQDRGADKHELDDVVREGLPSTATSNGWPHQ